MRIESIVAFLHGNKNYTRCIAVTPFSHFIFLKAIWIPSDYAWQDEKAQETVQEAVTNKALRSSIDRGDGRLPFVTSRRSFCGTAEASSLTVDQTVTTMWIQHIFTCVMWFYTFFYEFSVILWILSVGECEMTFPRNPLGSATHSHILVRQSKAERTSLGSVIHSHRAILIQID